jgi:23S rRNA pseudouridine1911/1915/1917 synthase
MTGVQPPDPPRIIAVEEGYIVAWKPAGLHSAPLKKGGGSSLLDYCTANYPEVGAVRGKQPWEGGLLHRLDRETQGLVLIARSQEAFDTLAAQQKAGVFVKDYEAICVPAACKAPGFPPIPEDLVDALINNKPFLIKSGFRAWGPGRKQVRPIPVKDNEALTGAARAKIYQTELLETMLVDESGGTPARYFRLRLSRGFRHQIRCHLAWLGWPILNDPLYGGMSEEGGTMELLAQALRFNDPLNGEPREYRLPHITVRQPD